MEVRKAVIPAAGLGLRFLPATKSQPKEMLPIIDKPAIHFIVEEAVAAGLSDIIIITGRGKRAIEDYFDKNFELEEHIKSHCDRNALAQLETLSNSADIHYVRQREQKGLGHAILCAEKHIGGEPFAVLLGDDIVEGKSPCIGQTMGISKRYGSSSVAVEKTPISEISRYGVIDGVRIEPGIFKVKGFVEKPESKKAPSDLAMIGRYVLAPEIFDCIQEVKPGAKGEIQLTDALSGLLNSQEVYAYEFKGVRYDIGDKMDYLRAMVESALRRDDTREKFAEYLKEACRKLDNGGA